MFSEQLNLFLLSLFFFFSKGILSQPERNKETKEIGVWQEFRIFVIFIRLTHTSLLTLLLFPLLSSLVFSSLVSSPVLFLSSDSADVDLVSGCGGPQHSARLS